MVRRQVFDQGDIVVVTLDPAVGRELQGSNRPALVLSTRDFNEAMGKALVAPISQGANFARYGGYAASLMGTGTKTHGVVLLTDVRVMDLEARKAARIESVPDAVLQDVIARMLTLFD